MINLALPTRQELALIYYKDRHYDEAFSIYDEIYKSGDHDLNVVLPLVDLYMLYGDTDQSIALMEQTAEEHPDSEEIQRHLGELYKEADRPTEYMLLLERMAAKDPNKPLLEELIGLYKEYEMNEPMKNAYQKLVDLGDREESVLYGLAFLEARDNQLQMAVNTLALVPVSSYQSVDTIELLVNVLLDQNRPEEAFAAAEEFLGVNHSIPFALQLAQHFEEHRDPQLAWDLLTPYVDKMGDNPELFSALVQYGEQIGKKGQIYKWGKELYEQGRLSFLLMDSFLALAMRDGDQETVDRILAQVDPDQFPDWLLIELLFYSAEKNDPFIMKRLEESLREARLKDNPFLQVAFYLAKHPTLEEFKGYYNTLLAKGVFSEGEKLELVNLLNTVSRPEEAHVVLSSIDSLIDFSPYQIDQYTLSALQMGQLDQVEELVGKALLHNPSIEPELSLTKLYIETAKGNREFVMEGIKETSIDAAQLEAISSLAVLYKHPELSLDIATAWNERAPSSLSRLAYAEALVLNKRYDEAFPLLDELIHEHPDRVDLIAAYLTAYLAKAKESPEEMANFKVQLNHYLNNPDISEEDKASWAYLFIDQGQKEVAASVLRYLAEGKPYLNGYVQDYLFLFGDEPPPEVVDWVAKRASMSTELEDKAGWIEFLLDHEKYCLILTLVDEGDLFNRKLARIYLTALGELSMRLEMQRILYCLINREESPKQLKIYGRLALDFGVQSEALAAYRKAQCYLPEDLDVAYHLGISAFLVGSYSEAYENLTYFLQYKPKDYKALYFVGEILWTWDCKCNALDYFAAAEREIDALKGLSKDERKEPLMLLGEIYYRQKRELISYMHFSWLNTLWPEDLDIVSSYADVLIAGQLYETALCLLNRYITTPCVDCADFQGKQGQALLRAYQYKARALWTLGCTQAADCLIQELFSYFDQIDDKWLVYEILGEYENYIERYRASCAAYWRSYEWNPENESVPKTIWDNYQPWRSYGRASMEARLTQENLSEHIWSGEYYKRLQSGYFFKGITEYDNFSALGVLNPRTGDTVSFGGARYRGEYNVGYDATDGNRYLVGLFIGAESFGGRLQYLRRDIKGYSSLTLEYHYPSWEYDQMVAYMGTYDQIRLDRAFHFNREFYFEGYTAFRFWNIDHLSNLAKSWRNLWSLVYSFNGPQVQRYMGTEGFIDFIYELDAEYVIDRKTGINTDGERFDRCNLLTQETHSVQIVANKIFNRMMRAEAFVGYSYNRFGKGGFPFGGSLILEKEKCWMIRFDASQAPSTVSTGLQQIFKIEVKIPL